jgi:dihydrofolate reductase
MRKIVVSEYVSLDGVFEEPGEWSFDFFNDEAEQFKFDELFASDLLLLGRKTYEGFAAAWPSMSDERGFADRMNSLPKLVASTTLDEAEWNASLVRENVAEEVSKLKQQPGRDILVGGSAELARTLMQHDLVDEYRFMLHPVVLGKGRRFFKDGTETKVLKLVDAKTFSSGVAVLTYRPSGTKND